MREVVALALAKHRGQTLTADVARAILRDLDADRSINPHRFGTQAHGPYILQCERLRDALHELQDQRLAYLAERHPDRAHAVNWLRLLDLSCSGAQAIFTARDADGTMVASMWLFIGQSLNTGALAATDDLFYIDPAHRGGMLAARLWRFAERAMFDYGVQEAAFLSRMDNGADRLAKFMGYTPDAIRVTKACYSGMVADLPTRHKEKML
jgi:GNAT superfamily N-acetyltransferase